MKFIDFEVFQYDWLCVIIDPSQKTKEVVVNDPDKLTRLYEENKNDIWVGFNIRHYDQYIFKGILLGMNPKEINDWIIVQDKAGWQFSRAFNKIPLLFYDTMPNPPVGLKTLEGFLGSNIKETDVDFTLNRKLTEEEIRQTVEYCTHDVMQTIDVFLHMKNEFDAQMSLIKMFPEVLSISDISKTKAQLSAKILECERVDRDDEFDLFVLPCIQIEKYTDAIRFFMNPENHNYEIKKKMMIAGLEHTLAWGGVHAGKEKYHNSGKDRQIWHVDVASFYPRLMIFHDLLTRNSKKPEKFKQIYDRRIQLKHEGKKKEQAPLKIVINGTYGISKAPTSTAYDPRNANLICINGQLMLIDLIEHLEKIEGFELIQSNTDGLIISLPDTDDTFDQMDDVCYEWETRCNMELEFDQIEFITQKDVNNYVFKFTNGGIERKGAYVKELSALDNDLPIVNKAVVDRIVENIPVEKTINDCDDLIQFQKIVKLSDKYDHVEHEHCTPRTITTGVKVLKHFQVYDKTDRYTYKSYRVFASNDRNDGRILKVKSGKNPEKFANTPEHCRIVNDDVNGVKCPSWLDRKYYIQMAKERLVQYGINDSTRCCTH